MTAHAHASYESAAHCGAHGPNAHRILHSNLYFATKDEVKAYNELLSKHGVFQADDKLTVVSSDKPVNAMFDGSVKLLPNASAEAKDEALGS